MGNASGKTKPELPKHAPMKVALKTGKYEPMFKMPNVFPKKQCLLRLLKSSRIYDYLIMEEEFIKRNARKSMRAIRRNEEKIIRKLRGSPTALGRVHELFEDEKHAVVVVEGCKREWYIPVLSIVDRNQIRIGSLVMLNVRGALKNIPKAVVGVLGDDVDQSFAVNKIEKAPKETFEEIGGLDQQIQEIKESVELPLVHPEYYEEMGITAPKGVILYGEPGTGKTLLAKAVANSTSATFIRATGADLVQKNSGDGAKVVREIFRSARSSAPSIIFIDEIDAVGTKRYDSTCGGEREVQRTLLELLNQMDGFDAGADVKIILATNRIDTLDPALIRPGRIDRKIEIPSPDNAAKLRIFEIHSSSMRLDKDVNFQKLIAKESSISGADCKAICTEAGLLALRAQRKVVCNEDFENATTKVISNKKSNVREEFFT